MLKAVFYFFIFAAALVHPTYSFQTENSFSLKRNFSQTEIHHVVAHAMSKANFELKDQEIRQLSHEVVKTSQCYGIDPFIFTALLWRESNFRSMAVSERRAVGLSQMTLVGVEEVLDRLDPESHRYLGFLHQMVKKCNPDIAEGIALQPSARIWRKQASHSTEEALVLGALLLRINLNSAVRFPQPINFYEVALEKYNGDPRVKARFAADVLQLAQRMTALPRVASSESKFLASIRWF